MRLGGAPQGIIASQFHHFVECNWTSKSNGVSGLVQSLCSCCWFALPLVQVDELPLKRAELVEEELVPGLASFLVLSRNIV